MNVTLNLVKSNTGAQKTKVTTNYSTFLINSTNIKSYDTVSFGHHLDDELEEKQQKLQEAKDDIDYYEGKIEEQKDTNAATKTRLNKKISQQKGENDGLSEQIEGLHGQIGKKDKKIETLRDEGQIIEENYKDEKKEAGILQKEQGQIMGDIQQDNESAMATRSEKLKTVMQESHEQFKIDFQKALDCPKNTLIQNVLNPTIQEAQGEGVQVPSGILIESNSDYESKKVFEWVAKKTNSNYVIIDASKFNSKAKLLKVVTKIAENSKKDFDKTQRRTFTFIENFESCATPIAENEAIIGGLKSFLDGCSDDYHNTLVVSTKNPSSLDPIISSARRFPIKIKLNDEFLKDKKLGLSSILKEISESESTGKALKAPYVDFLFNSTAQKLKAMPNSYRQAKLAGLEKDIRNKKIVEDVEISIEPETEKLKKAEKIQQATVVVKGIKKTTNKVEVGSILGDRGWNRIGGYANLKQYLDNVFVNKIEKEKSGEKVEIPNSMLIHGLDGTGKTTLVKALAERTNSNLIEINLEQPDKKIWEDLLKAADKSKDCYQDSAKEKRTILLLDNVDSIKKLTDGNASFVRNIKAFLLDCADKYKCTVLMTTTKPLNIHPELLGDLYVPIIVPDKITSEDIFEFYLKNITKKPIKYSHLASKTTVQEGTGMTYSGGKIQQIVESCKSDFIGKEKEITESDLIKKIDNIEPDISYEQLSKFYKDFDKMRKLFKKRL